MRPKKVGIYLLFLLVIYAVALFYVVGLGGRLMGAVINYFTANVWVFNAEDFLVSLRFSLVYGLWGGAGVWIFAKIDETKKRRNKEDGS